MATHGRLSRQSVLISSVLLYMTVSLFSCCNATSRSLERTDPRRATFTGASDSAAAEPMDSTSSCAGRSRASCRTTNVEPDVMQPEEMERSSRDPAATATEMSGSRRLTENLERMRNSESERMRDTESLRNEMRENEKMTDSGTMRDSERTRRDSDRMTDSERMRESKRIGQSERMRDSHRLRDSDRMRDTTTQLRHSDRMRDSNRMRDSDRMRDSERMRDSDRVRDSDRTRDSERMIDSDRVRDSDRMTDTQRMRDSDRMRDTHEVKDSHTVKDSERLRDSEKMWDSGKVRDSERAARDIERNQRARDIETDQSSARLRNSEWTGAKMRVVDSKSEGMRDSDRMRSTDRMGELDRLRDSDRLPIRDSDRMRDDSNRRMRDTDRVDQSDRMRDSDRLSDSETIGDSESLRDSRERMRNSERRTTDFESTRNSESRAQSEMMGDRDLERTRDSGKMRDLAAERSTVHLSFNEREKETATGTKSDHSDRTGDEERMTDFHVHGRRDLERKTDSESDEIMRDSTSDIHRDSESRISTAHVHSDRVRNSDSSVQAGSCKSNGADCRINAPDGKIRGSSSHEMDSEGMVTSTKAKQGLAASSCRLNGPDCHIDPDSETRRSHPTDSAERKHSTDTERMNSCIDGHCRNAAAQTIHVHSEMMQRGRNDLEELVDPAAAAPKLVKSDRSTLEISVTDAERITSERSSTMTEPSTMRSAVDSGKMRSTDPERLNIGSRKVSSEWRAGSHTSDTDTEGKRSRTTSGSKAEHITSKRSDAKLNGPTMDERAHDSQLARNAEIHDSRMSNSELMHKDTVSRASRSTMEPSSCIHGANCPDSINREIMHMSSSHRDSDTTEHRDDSEMMHSESTKMNPDRRGLAIHQKRVDSEESEMMRMESDQTRSSEFMGSDSKLGSTRMDSQESHTLP